MASIYKLYVLVTVPNELLDTNSTIAVRGCPFDFKGWERDTKDFGSLFNFVDLVKLK